MLLNMKQESADLKKCYERTEFFLVKVMIVSFPPVNINKIIGNDCANKQSTNRSTSPMPAKGATHCPIS